MRNLKRALSLALASVMLLGMMVVGTSAASYPDVDENDNVEAIEVLNAVKVMIGDRGNFRPDAAVNRHEMATIMAKLVLGNETADNYVGTHPFTDVFPWADKYVAACYENGLVSGTSATTFSGNQPLTAVQAAAMMLRALGYKDLSKGATDWRAPVTAMANQIRLFSGVASNPSEQLNRNQVAQLALNTLKSPVVDLKDGTFDITSGDGQIVITGGSREYIVRSSNESYARAINRTERAGTSASSVQGYTVELGEHLYNGKLRLEDTTDAFGRPARQWEYDGKEIGAYAKDELLRREYTTKVTGRDLYDLLGKTTIDEYDFIITVDGETEADTLKKGDNAYFTEGNLVRTNTNAIGATDKGVLTQVFVDSGNKDVYISIINTYLAKASKDYDTKKEEATFTVYGVEDIESGSAITLVKNTGDKSANTPYTEPLKVRVEDIDVSGVKEDDFFLVNVAEGEIKAMAEPEVMSEATITAFKKGSWVNSDGQIDYADTAKYDPEVLETYDDTNMKDTTFNIFLDQYGYMIGLEQNSNPDQYVFITGDNGGSSDLSSANADMAAIFLDGTMKVIEVNKKDSKITATGAIANTWCKYTVDKKGVYTLEQIADHLDATKKVKVAQWAQNVADGTAAPVYVNTKVGGSATNNAYTIDKGHVSLVASSDGVKYDNRVYGNDDTVYLNVSTAVINTKTGYSTQTTATGNGYSTNAAAPAADSTGNYYLSTATSPVNLAVIIDDVESVTTGVKSASVLVKDVVATSYTKSSGAAYAANEVAVPKSEIYTLYKDNGYVIAAVVIGEDEGVSSNFAYITANDYSRESYSSADEEWTWTLAAIVNGEDTELTEVGSTPTNLKAMRGKGGWFKVKYDANGYVKGYEAISFASSAGKYIDAVNLVEASVNAHDTVLMNAAINSKDALSYKNGTLYTNKAATEGFAVSPDVKTVVALSKLKSGTADPFDSVTDGYVGYKGLESAISDLDYNFKGNLCVLFEDKVATMIILDDRTGTTVDEGSDKTPTGSYSSAVDATAAAKIAGDPLNLAKAKVDDTNTLVLPAHYGQNVKQQLRDALAYLGYKVTGEEYNSTSKVWTFTTEKDGVTGKITCDVTKNTGNIGVTAAEYALVDVDGTKSYVAVDGTVAVTAPATNPGTGYIVSTDGGKTFAYGATYGNYTAVTGKDAVIKSGYVKVTAPSLATIAGVSGSTVTYTASGETVAASAATGYAKVGSEIVITVDFKTGTLTTAIANATLKATGYTAAISKAATLGASATMETVATDTVTFPYNTGTYTGGVYTFTKTVAAADMSGDITIATVALTNV